jgi:hypothetical protein
MDFRLSQDVSSFSPYLRALKYVIEKEYLLRKLYRGCWCPWDKLTSGGRQPLTLGVAPQRPAGQLPWSSCNTSSSHI